jgi:uncharacterized protein HemY
MAQYMMGDEPNARLALTKVAQNNSPTPDASEAERRVSLLSIDAERADATARAEVDDFLRAWPNDPAAMTRLAQFHLRDGSTDQAIKILDAIIAANPRYKPAVRQLASLYRDPSFPDPQAFQRLEQGYEMFPDDADISKALGVVIYRRGQYSRAIELLQAARRTQTDDPELLYYLGSAHAQLKQWSACTSELDRASQLPVPPELANKINGALAICSAASIP